MQTGQVTKSKSKPRNVLRGIVPTASGWDTPPSDLANLTDGDHTTTTGVGTKTTTGASQVIGTLSFDLGNVKKFLFGATFSCWSNTGSIFGYVEYSINGSRWYNPHGGAQGRTWIQTSESAASVYKFPPYDLQTRYLRLTFYSSAALNGNIRGLEVSGYELD